MSDELDTIVAPATAQGRGALAVVRIDGPRSLEIVSDLSEEKRTLVPRQATLLLFRSEGELIDEGMTVYFPRPRSFTGNDLVEITLHGSPYVVSQFLRAVLSRGARMAEPGEFTERAVLNGKLDIIQAEAIHDLIASRTELQARLSLTNLGGELSRAASAVRSVLLDVISRLEAALDFADEGYEFIERREAMELCSEALRSVRELESSFARGRVAVSGLTAVILGAPNSGKSTLMNFLCGSERAIVTPVAGTTRDLLRETVEIGGLPVTLVDTAGLRETEDRVEAIGVQRAREEGGRAEIVLYLIDSVKGADARDVQELKSLPEAHVVYTKVDIAPPPSGSAGIAVPTRQGLQELLDRLDGLVRERFAPVEGTPTIVNERQRKHVEDCAEALVSAIEAIQKGLSEELVVVDLYRAAGAIGSLTGVISQEEILNSIFAKFCIGK